MSTEDRDSTDAPTTSLDAADVGPTVDLADVDLPPAVAEGLQDLYGTDRPIEDAAAWIEATRDGVQEVEGRPPTPDDLCTAADGDHAFDPATDAPGQSYVCVLDPIAYPFITGEPGTIRSTTQIREESVTIEVETDGVAVSHPDAVISIGVSTNVDGVGAVTPEVVYRQVCGYIHVFADEAEYGTWADDVDAATTHVPVETGIGLAKALAEALF